MKNGFDLSIIFSENRESIKINAVYSVPERKVCKMKKLCLFLAVFSLIALVLSAASFSGAEDVINVDVVSLGAVPNDGDNDDDAFVAAFVTAKNSTVPVVITIPEGTYNVGKTFNAYPNTTVIAYGATVLSNKNTGVIIRGRHVNEKGKLCSGDDCVHGGYGQCHDVSILGGTWGMDVSRFDESELGSTVVFTFKHSKNITIRDTVCVNASNHFFNFSSSSDVLVENVTFRDSAPCNDESSSFWDSMPFGTERRYYSVEAIHLDYCDGDGESGSTSTPLDKTPAKNITVKGCKFSNIYCGVGNHHLAKTEKSSNVTIEDCVFDGVLSYCVNGVSIDALTVKNNRCKNVSGFVKLSASNNAVIEGNSAKKRNDIDIGSPMIAVRGKSTAVLKENSLSGKSNFGVFITENASAQLEGNKTNGFLRGITCSNGSLNASNNEIKNASDYGICCVESGACTISGNNVSCKKPTACVYERNSPGTVISGNEISSEKGVGIMLRYSNGVTVSGNNVKTGSSAVNVLGKDANTPCLYTLSNNVFDSTNSFDLVFSKFSRCVVSGNVLKNYTVSINENEGEAASYSGDLGLPSLEEIVISQSSFVFDGTEKKPGVTVKDSVGRTLEEEKDYSLSFENCVSAGNAAVIVSGKGIFKDQELRKLYTIAKKSITPTVYLSATSFVFDGNVKTPTVTVKDGETVLSASEYSVTYSSGRKDAGKYAVTVTLKGNFYGSAVKTFTITPKAVSPKIVLLKKSFVFSGEDQRPALKVYVENKELPSSDFSVTYPSNSRYVGTYSVKVTLKGNYSGSESAEYSIKKAPQSIKASAVTPAPAVAFSKSKAKTLSFRKLVVLSDAHGKKSFEKRSGSKYLSVNGETGAVSVREGTPKGEYRVNIRINAAGTANYNAGATTVKVTVRVG